MRYQTVLICFFASCFLMLPGCSDNGSPGGPQGGNPFLGTWKTRADTFTMVAEVDSVRLMRTTDTAVGHIVSGGGASDTLCVLFYADSLGMMFAPYQKLAWNFLSATKIILERYGYFSTQQAADSADYIITLDTLTKQ